MKSITIAALVSAYLMHGNTAAQTPRPETHGHAEVNDWIYGDRGVGVLTLESAAVHPNAPVQFALGESPRTAGAAQAAILTSAQIAGALGIDTGPLSAADFGALTENAAEVEIVTGDFDHDGDVDIGVAITGVVRGDHDWRIARVLFVDRAMVPIVPRGFKATRMQGTPSEFRIAYPTCTDAVVCCSYQPKVAAIKAPSGFNGQQLVATCSTQFGNEHVVGMVDLNAQCTAMQGWSPTPPYAHEPPMFHNEGAGTHEWTLDNLGTVFGLTIDDVGHIYVTATSAYNSDVFPTVHGPGTGGEIYKIDGTTGNISLFAGGTLPNSGQGLGNITYDCRNDQFFVSNMDDGLIYRIPKNVFASGGTYNHGVAGRSVVGMTPIPDNTSQGFTPLGRRVWGLEVAASPTSYAGTLLDRYRLYYSVWWEHMNYADPNGEGNEIWSVGLDPISGAFLPGTTRRELVLPSHTSDWSCPVSDISFRPDGVMLLAERSMFSDTSVLAHRSRVLAYQCNFASFTRMPGVGSADRYLAMGVSGSSSAGGIDYDPLTYGPCEGRVWATVDQLAWPFPYIYGLAGIDRDGGSSLDGTSILIDLDGNYSTSGKTLLGDVEIPCGTCFGQFPCR